MLDWKKWPTREIEAKNLPDSVRKIRPMVEKLYYRGEWNDDLFKKSLAVVGSRRMSRYGQEVVGRFMPELVANKVTIISGFMYGIDTEAHRTCVGLGGKTVAVLGGGLDFLTPVENDELYSQILNNGGLVISEYEADFKPTLWSFPQRNRIVAGLASLGVLVIEAGMKSGSLITVKLGRRQGKQIWTIPGPITSPTSTGANWLIQEGLARLTTGANEIVGKNESEYTQESLLEDNLNKVERKIVDELELGEASTDELAKKLGVSTPEVSTNLTTLTIKDLVEEEAGKFFLVRGRGSSRQ